MNEIAENMKYQVERMEAELKRLKEKYAKEAMTCASTSRMAIYSRAGLALVAAGGSGAINDDHRSMPRIGNDDNNESPKYTPIGEIAREVQKVEVEIEAATSLTAEKEKEEEEKRVVEPVGKKERLESSDNDQDSDPSPSPSNA